MARSSGAHFSKGLAATLKGLIGFSLVSTGRFRCSRTPSRCWHIVVVHSSNAIIGASTGAMLGAVGADHLQKCWASASPSASCCLPHCQTRRQSQRRMRTHMDSAGQASKTVGEYLVVNVVCNASLKTRTRYAQVCSALFNS